MRKQYLIDKKFQTRFAMELMIFVMLTPFIVWANIFMLGQFSHSQDIYAQGAVTQWGFIGVLIQQRWGLMLLLFATNFFIFYFIIIYYSHRVAGPVYKFSKTLDALAEGNIGSDIKLRKRDYFDSLGDSINNISRNLRQNISELKDASDALNTAAAASQDGALKKAAERIDKVLANFTIEEDSLNPETSEPTEQEANNEESGDTQTSG